MNGTQFNNCFQSKKLRKLCLQNSNQDKDYNFIGYTNSLITSIQLNIVYLHILPLHTQIIERIIVYLNKRRYIYPLQVLTTMQKLNVSCLNSLPVVKYREFASPKLYLYLLYVSTAFLLYLRTYSFICFVTYVLFKFNRFYKEVEGLGKSLFTPFHTHLCLFSSLIINYRLPYYTMFSFRKNFN